MCFLVRCGGISSAPTLATLLSHSLGRKLIEFFSSLTIGRVNLIKACLRLFSQVQLHSKQTRTRIFNTRIFKVYENLQGVFIF